MTSKKRCLIYIGIEVSATTISTITNKVWSLVEEWQNRPTGTCVSHYLSGRDLHQNATGWQGGELCCVYRLWALI